MSRSKYHAVPTIVDGIRFASKAEARRYGELKLLQKAGEIRNLTLQPRFPLWAFRNGEPVLVAAYVADFGYDTAGGAAVIEDVKGTTTETYRLKKRWVEAQYDIRILETGRRKVRRVKRAASPREGQ